MRRSIAFFTMILAILVALTGCHALIEEADASISVYATFYPIYALTEAVMRDVPDSTLHLLVQPQDGCLRNYQLSDWDIYILSRAADALIMGGRGLESFEDAIFQWGESGPALSAVLYNLELYNSTGATDAEAESHLSGANPHLYMSLEGAKEILQSISATMQSLDPGYSDTYVRNAQAAMERLDALLESSRKTLINISDRRVVLMNEALIYPALDYDLDVVDWIDRESGEALYDDALAACLERLEGSKARVVLIEKQAPQAFVEAIESAGFVVARLDILSTHREGEGFEGYLNLQASNATAIQDAFERAYGEEID